MAFILKSTPADAYLSYAAADGTWKVNRDPVSIDRIYFDPASLKVGWGRLELGRSAEWVWDEPNEVQTEAPSGLHRRGFFINVWGKNFGYAKWSSTSTGAILGLEGLLKSILPVPDEYMGQWAEAAFLGATHQKIGRGSTQVPNLAFVSWADPHFYVDDDTDGPNGQPPASIDNSGIANSLGNHLF